MNAAGVGGPTAKADLTDDIGTGPARLCAVTTLLRRKLALVGILAALAVPALSACGDHYATDRENDLANGAFDLGSGMRILAPRIVASQDGQGVLIGTIALNPTADAAVMGNQTAAKHALTGISSPDGRVDPVTGINRKVDNQGVLNLSQGGIKVTGSFKAGDIVPLTFKFADGEQGTVQTVVVTPCDYNEGAGSSGWTGASSHASPQQVPSPGPYDCAYPSVPPIAQ